MENKNHKKNIKDTHFLTLIKSFWKPVLWGIAIIILSLMSGNDVKKISIFNFEHADKIVHFIMYFVFSFFLFESFMKYFKTKINPVRKIVYVITISVLFGIIMEILQIILVVNRSGEILDFIANTTGSVLALVSFKYIQNLLKIILSPIRSKSNSV
ncbi:MAG: VanZ family protein [Bacteroidales bacterium]|nr:VanZ family protein [Bacteroidales bacterium]